MNYVFLVLEMNTFLGLGFFIKKNLKKTLPPTELYDYCIKEGYADKNLIAKWKKQGYENLCCLRCIQTRDTNFGTNCICRVPKSKLEVVSPPPNYPFFTMKDRITLLNN